MYVHACIHVCVYVAHISQLTHGNQKTACKVIFLPTPCGSPGIHLGLQGWQPVLRLLSPELSRGLTSLPQAIGRIPGLI